VNNPHKNHNSNKPLVLGSGRKKYGGATGSNKGSPSGMLPANYNSSAQNKKLISKTRLPVNQDGQRNGGQGSQTARVNSNRKYRTA